MDAYLEEELMDNFTYCIQNPLSSDIELKNKESRKSVALFIQMEV